MDTSEIEHELVMRYVREYRKGKPLFPIKPVPVTCVAKRYWYSAGYRL